MKTSFQKTLLLLFIFFALIPTILLILSGYYISTESFNSQNDTDNEYIYELIDYYNNTLFEQLEITLNSYPDDKIISSSFDFLVRNDSLMFIETRFSRYPYEEFKDIIILNSNQKEYGFFQYQNRYWQYYKLVKNDSDVLIGGIAHDISYSALIEKTQLSNINLSTQRILQIKYLNFLLIIFITLSIIIAILSYYFSSRIAKKLSAPLLELNVASQKIADGDFDQKVTAQGSGEIKSLIDNFNLMAYKLSDTTSRLTQSERVAAWRHIARRFAHELKNPLQPIMVSLYRIEKSLKESNQYEQFAEPLRAASEELKHLEELAERFSTLAKLPPPKLEKTNLNDFIKSIANLYDELLINFEFELILPDDIIISSIDAAYFREAIHNLLQNAVDASEPGGKIILKLYQDKDKISISVQDFGQGIKTDIAKSVRIPYFTTKVKGSGLGLAIVEKTVNELNGSLHIESREGVGTKVSISLPLK